MTDPVQDRDRLLSRLDLNLLVALDVLLDERNVTRAAERLAVGQPAMSASLARLRRFFDDPLLVRRGRTLVPTPTAVTLGDAVRAALETIESAVRARDTFDPATDTRAFTVLASDYTLLLYAGLLDRLTREAPGVRITVRTIPPVMPEPLPADVDVMIAPGDVLTDLSGLRSTTLFTDRFVCAVAADHPEVGESLTEQQFRTLPYVAYAGGSATTHERQLRSLGVERPVDVAAQSFVVLPLMLPGTRSFALVQQRLGARFAGPMGLRLLEPPVALDPLVEVMIWSPRHDTDPAHRWLRERIRAAGAAL